MIICSSKTLAPWTPNKYHIHERWMTWHRITRNCHIYRFYNRLCPKYPMSEMWPIYLPHTQYVYAWLNIIFLHRHNHVPLLGNLYNTIFNCKHYTHICVCIKRSKMLWFEFWVLLNIFVGVWLFCKYRDNTRFNLMVLIAMQVRYTIVLSKGLLCLYWI